MTYDDRADSGPSGDLPPAVRTRLSREGDEVPAGDADRGVAVDRGTGRLLADGGQSQKETADDEGGTEGADDGSEQAEGEATGDSGEAGGDGDASQEMEASAENEDGGDGAEEAATEGDGEESQESEAGTTVLYLDLEGLFLDLLGLEVDLEEVELDVSAVPGEGRLLGNLLSAVGGLADGVSLSLSGLVDEVVGGMTGSDEEGESPVGEATDKARSALSDAADDLPVDEFVSQLAAEVVRQLLGGSSDGQGGEAAESAEASG